MEQEKEPQPFFIINNFIGSCSQGNLELEVHLGLVADIHQEYTYVLPSEYLANMFGWLVGVSSKVYTTKRYVPMSSDI